MRNNFKYMVIISGCILLLGLIVGSGGYIVISTQRIIRMENEGRVLIQHIEDFYAEHKRLPENFEIIDYENEHCTGPFYEKIDSLTYSIYFCEGFDNYYMYDSKITAWYYFPHQTKFQTIILKNIRTNPEY